MKKVFINHSRPTISKLDINNVIRVLKSGEIASNKEVAKFEKELSDYIGHDEGIAVNSGTNALYLTLLSLDVNKDDEVILPSYLCIAPLNAITYLGAKPKLVDINENDYNLSLGEVKKNITKKTKAIIAPHMFGDCIRDIDEIVSLGIPVIEDCALSIGATTNGKKAGSFSDLAIFSFYATKVITTGHGGMILSSSKNASDKIRDYMQYDNRERYNKSFNFRMTDIQAAIGRSQLSNLENLINRRREIAERYNEEFKYKDSIIIPRRHEDSIYFRYIIEVDDASKFMEKISKKGVECKKPIYKPLHNYFGVDNKNFQNTEKAYKKYVSIPIYPSMTRKKIDYIIKAILELK